MFCTQYQALCQKAGKSPNGVAKELGLSSGTVTFWKNGKIPKSDTLKEIADFFGVTVDYMLGNEEKEKGTTQMVAPITELSPREVQVALAYRAQDDAVKAAIDKMLDIPPLAEEGLA